MSLTPFVLIFTALLLLLILLSGKSGALWWALLYPGKPMPPNWQSGGFAPGATNGGGAGSSGGF